MKLKALAFATSLFCIPSLLFADSAKLKEPVDLGKTDSIDVAAISFIYDYDDAAGEFIIKEVRIAALEGEVIEGKWQTRPGGEGYAVPVADMPPAMASMAATLKDRAVNHYVAKKGYETK